MLRRLTTTFAILVMVAALTVPARADTLSGTYRIVTRTGIHMILTLIQNGSSFNGMYVGANGIAGRITGTMTNDPTTTVSYTWEERNGDALNERAAHGWGTLKFNDAGNQLTAAWGYAGQQNAVGFWNGTLLNP
ncbi:MAG TPA: hypothetical protein VHS78_17340 [Candidatus Elarobacter sp.]|nr:hypothetical protein [Candidatus Elarobacter sp.]